jgi:uncharacterized protein YkwD
MKRITLVSVTIALAATLLAGCMSADESDALNAINADRVAGGLGGVVENAALVTKAQQWARHLADASGGQCSMATLVHSDVKAGAPGGWRALGENIGCRIAPGDVRSFVGPLQVAFMASPGHRANIMNGSYNAGGAGLATAPAAVGHGWLVVYEAQEFARL